MKVAVFSAKPYDREFLDKANAVEGHHLKYFDDPLDLDRLVEVVNSFCGAGAIGAAK